MGCSSKDETALSLLLAVAQMPKALMRGDKAFERAPPILLRRHAPACQHRFKRLEQLLSDHQVLRIAGMVKGDQYLVG
jgi:hypothetical protein